jgi:hypothetical protein
VNVFVSYDRSDRERFVDPLAERLREHGVRVWVDHGEIGPGDNVVTRIFSDGLTEADVVVAVISRAGVANPWCQLEQQVAVFRLIGGRARILVVRLDDTEPPPPLTVLAWVDVDPDGDWTPQFERLLRSIRAGQGATSSAS